jgi:hypothetical protein
VKTELLKTPRPVPGRLLPAAGAAVVLARALAVFLVADWPLKGWVLGAALWAGLEAFALVIARLRQNVQGVAGSSLQGIELFVKAVAVLGVVVAAAQSDGKVALGAILVYALAYTLQLTLSVATYFGSETT